MFALSPARQTLLLFLLALAVLVPGIWEATGLSGKDEFFLGLRTPMEMIAGDHWLVPFLDGVPRIRKPPLLYWLGRASFELFGPSLAAARLIDVLFAALLVVATAGIARRLSGEARTGLIAAGILLGCLGLASEGRRFMLDVPVAALSTAAFWAFLAWLDLRRFYLLTAGFCLLAAGFLVKGPIVALVFGGGCLGLLASRRLHLADLRPHWPALLANALLFAALALPWFFVVNALYPEAAQQVLADELESRRFLNLSPGIVLGLGNIALPWIFVLLAAAWRRRRDAGLPRLLLVWFLATFLPFLFIKSFDRYLIGSLVPAAILIAISLPEMQQRWPFRLGLGLALLFGGALATLAVCFGQSGGYWLLAPALYLTWAWWQERGMIHTLAAPALFWLAVLWGVFPALGVNAVPEGLVHLARERPVAFFNGPQPALLPILSGHAQRHYNQLDAKQLAALASERTPVFVEEDNIFRFQTALTAGNYQAHELGSFRTLATHGSGLRFARTGSGWAEWRAALAQGSPEPLMTRIVWFEVLPQ
jgi:4-amino-4-deoxy-L-arabinose transferase-like glycosyltransferase